VFPSNTIVLQQGSVTKSTDPVYVVVEGEVRVVQEIPVKNPKKVIHGILSDELKEEDVSVYTSKSIFVEVSRMGEVVAYL
jgi:CRP-like cAMP-binding protein